MARARLTPRPRPTEELQQEMIHNLGWIKAHDLIRREADVLRVAPDSGAAIRSAYATYQTGRKGLDQTQPEQEPML